MTGQWTGRYRGTNAGQIILDIDRMDGHLNCAILLADDTPELPGVFARFRAPKTLNGYTATIQTLPVNRVACSVVSRAEYDATFPNTTFPATADIEIEERKGRLRVKWKTSIGTHGTASLSCSDPTAPSKYRAEKGVRTWADFRKFASGLEPGRFVFRGQQAKWRLRTSFHRTNRSDLVQFAFVDVPRVAARLGAILEHVFDMSRFGEMGALYNLAQHHGYPTPLLDWTRSPYIAAYFAFSQARVIDDGGKEFVRIFIFDVAEWENSFAQYDKVALSLPHLSRIELVPFKNNRVIPQQSVVTLTNVDDVEGYIAHCEKLRAKKFLRVIDLPMSVRREAMSELAMMGITAGSLFPGLDGACEELRASHFDF